MDKEGIMNLLGKTTINPIIFYTGKFSGYLTWVHFFFSIFNIHFGVTKTYLYNKHISIVLLVIGVALTGMSLINLGGSTRLGLPSENTIFKRSGLYKYSRNPMYVGFNLLTIAAIVNSYNLIILLLGTYSIIVYHFIILGEENFLKKRFGNEYLEYSKSVKRYM
jgi:protein-S-isoprenylcysteine O-methyltransferase Ste14